MDAKLQSLMECYNQLGQLLPKADSIDDLDDNIVAETQLILDEMTKTKAEIDVILAEYKRKQK